MKCFKQQSLYKFLRVPCYVIDESCNTMTFFLLFARYFLIRFISAIKTGIV